MKLNKKLELGIKAVAALKDHHNPAQLSQLAVEVGTTEHFLAQVMRNLRNANIVTVKRGPSGGYTLDTSKSFTAWDVARAVGRFEEGLDAGDTSPANMLRISIANAFYNTVI